MQRQPPSFKSPYEAPGVFRRRSQTLNDSRSAVRR
jgi:hypothetical protein